MLTELNKILETVEFEEEGYVRVQSVECGSEAVHMILDVNTGDEASTHQRWEVQSVGRTYAWQFVEGVAYDITVERNHVVLWPFTRPQVELFFNGIVNDPLSLLGALYQEHSRVTDGWFSFDRFLIHEKHLPKLLEGGYGKLADGPDLLIENYANTLKRYGVEPSTLPPRLPTLGENNARIPIEGELVALVFGGSYLVARDFTAKRIIGAT